LRRVVPRAEVLLFMKKKASSVKQADLRIMFKKAFECVCRSTIVLPYDLLSPASSFCSAMKTPETTDDPQPDDEGNIKMEDTYDKLCSSSIGALTKNYL
jgi:hypothetical protein